MEKRKHNQIIKLVKSDSGYLLLSTLSLLILSGLFSQAVIKISADQLIQLEQLATTYQEKAALNMGEEIFKHQLSLDELNSPTKGSITTSVGVIDIDKITEEKYQMVLTTKNNHQYIKDILVEKKEKDLENEENLEKENKIEQDDNLEKVIDSEKEDAFEE